MSIQKNLYRTKLKKCGTNPMTGFYRDGYCNTGPDDKGTHTVCSIMTDEFLDFAISKGDDLSTGTLHKLKEGDNWCLSALQYKQAQQYCKQPQMIHESTNIKTLDYL